MSVYKAIPQEDGEYIKSDGTRYTLRCCRRHSSPLGINVGWVEFADLETCLEEWGLCLVQTGPPQEEASH